MGEAIPEIPEETVEEAAPKAEEKAVSQKSKGKSKPKKTVELSEEERNRLQAESDEASVKNFGPQ